MKDSWIISVDQLEEFVELLDEGKTEDVIGQIEDILNQCKDDYVYRKRRTIL